MTDSVSSKDATMLVAFRAENVRSFRDPVELSMEATALAEPDVPRELPWRRDGRTMARLLPVAGLFGANASGKTNLLQVMDDMRRLVLTSFTGRRRSSGKHQITRHPFKLDPECKTKPSRYEVEVIIDGIRHEYGFVVDDTRVLEEWAVHYPRGKAATILRRDGDYIVFRGKSGREALENITRPDALALSVAAAIELPELMPLNDWFDRNLLLCSESSRHRRWDYTAGMFAHPELREKVLEFMQIADLGITDIRTRKPDPEMLERLQKLLGNLAESDEAEPFVIDPDRMVRFFMSHRGHGNDVELESYEESQGTLVWFGIAGPVLSVLAGGAVMLADELESSLHPALVAEIVKIFQSKESNPNNAQLIFNSHEARLLGNSETDRILGRDQAWFVEKSNAGDSRIYPLTDLNPRKSEAVARRYLEGRYGATPILSGAEFKALAAHTARG